MLFRSDVDADARTGWLGYDLVVNREKPADGMTSIERLRPDGSREPTETAAAIAFSGNELELAVPRSVLGTADRKRVVLDFKWVDGITIGGEAAVLTTDGDAAPNDRFNFRAAWDE